MENQKNLFLAIIISMAIIFGFQLLVPQPERTPMTEEQTNDESLVDLSIQKSSSTVLADRGDVINQSGRVNFDNSKIKGSINLNGAVIDDLTLEEAESLYASLPKGNREEINQTKVLFEQILKARNLKAERADAMAR